MAEEVEEDVEYEPIRSSGGWRVPVGVALIALLALLGTQRLRIGGGPEPIAAQASPAAGSQQPPRQLADGSPAAPPPDPIAGRFSEPVIAATAPQQLPDRVQRRCRTAPFAGQDAGTAGRYRHDLLQGLLDATSRSDAVLTPEALGVLRLGRSPSPPGYRGRYQASCLAVRNEGRWDVASPYLGFAVPNGPAARAPGRAAPRSVLLTTPARAAWAVQERPGWWLAQPLRTDAPFWQAVVERGRTELRIVYLDADGGVVEDTTVEQPGTRSPPARAHALDEQVVVGPIDRTLRDLRSQPLRRCSRDGKLCVWVGLTAGEVHATAAFGPDRLDVPPFGFVGYCPASAALEGSTTAARFRLNGELVSGTVPRGPVTYPVRYDYDRDRIVVDLTSPEPGPPADDGDGPPATCAFRSRPIGAQPG